MPSLAICRRPRLNFILFAELSFCRRPSLNNLFAESMLPTALNNCLIHRNELTYSHAFAHDHACTHTYTYSHACMRTATHAYALPHMHTHCHAFTCTSMHAKNTATHAYIQPCMHIHTAMHAQAQPCMHSHSVHSHANAGELEVHPDQGSMSRNEDGNHDLLGKHIRQQRSMQAHEAAPCPPPPPLVQTNYPSENKMPQQTEPAKSEISQLPTLEQSA